MHIEMEISGSKLSYVAGDHVAIFPRNDPQLVGRIGELLHTDMDMYISLTNVDRELGKIACNVSYRSGDTHPQNQISLLQIL